MFTSWEVTPTCSLTYGGQAPLEICRWVPLAQDQPPPVSSHTDGLELLTQRQTDQVALRLQRSSEAQSWWHKQQPDGGGAGHRWGDVGRYPLTCARLLLVYQGSISGGTVKGCFQKDMGKRIFLGSDKKHWNWRRTLKKMWLFTLFRSCRWIKP